MDVLHVRVRVAVEHGSQAADLLRYGNLIARHGKHHRSAGVTAVDGIERRLV